MRDRLIELLDNAKVEVIEHYPDGTPCMSYTKKAVDRKVVYKLADYLLENGVIVPPCKVGDKFYRVEMYCTEGGYWDEPRRAYSGTCEDCCEECDGEKRIVEYTFCSVKQILELERDFGKTVFLTREEAEKALKEGVQE